jgi:enamine deaminase RidA (YjgF/YER057c/UK114 family)
LGAFVKVKDEFIAEPYPAWTAIGVSELLTDGALAEIRAIAKRG